MYLLEGASSSAGHLSSPCAMRTTLHRYANATADGGKPTKGGTILAPVADPYCFVCGDEFGVVKRFRIEGLCSAAEASAVGPCGDSGGGSGARGGRGGQGSAALCGRL